MELSRKEYLTRLSQWTLDKSRSSYGEILRYFPDVHLGNGHYGLSILAKESGYNVNKLMPGQYLVFVNRQRSALKMFAAGNVVAHLKMPHGSKLDLMAIKYLPMFFNGSSIDWTGAISKRIQNDFK